MVTKKNNLKKYTAGGDMFNSYDQYGLGSWLKDNVGNVAQTLGGAALMFVPGGQVAGASMMASGVGGAVSNTVQGNQEDQELAKQKGIATRQAMSRPTTNYAPMMPNGGPIRVAKPVDPTALINVPLAERRNIVPTTYGVAEAKETLNLGQASKLPADVDYTEMVRDYRAKHNKPGLPEDSRIFPTTSLSGGTDFLTESKRMNNLPVDNAFMVKQGDKLTQAVFTRNDDLIEDPNRANRVLDRRVNALTREQYGKDVSKTYRNIREGIRKKGLNPYYADGGHMPNSYDQNLDFITNYEAGGKHEQNPHGGIPIGKKARVEQGEVRVDFPNGSYIFSDKF